VRVRSINMRDGDAQCERNGCRSGHFVTVRNQQEQVGAHLTEKVAETERGKTNGLGHARVSVGTQQKFNAAVNFEAVLLDFLNGVAEFGGEMRAEGKDTQVNIAWVDRSRSGQYK
jgi:hypothetical protein